MNCLKIISILTVSVLLLFTGSLFSHAQGYDTWVMDNWNKDKEESFKEAREQDKFILLFVGRPTCGACQDMSEMLCNPENPFKQILDDNYITLYKWYDDENDKADVYEYIEKYIEEREIQQLNRQLPWLFIINPDKEGESVASSYRPYPEYRPNEETMRKFLAVDLLENNDLDWYVNKNKVLELAQAQSKYIFKFQGSGTSPNSQQVINLLVKNPLKQILEENFILWYVDDSDCGCDISLAATVETKDEDSSTNPLPYISIIDPKFPDELLEELWGDQDAKTLEEILKKYTVSNEKIYTNNQVYIFGDVLYISNQTGYEQISVYSLTGQRVAVVGKNDFTACIDASRFPKGILVISSSTGWSKKILKQ